MPVLESKAEQAVEVLKRLAELPFDNKKRYMAILHPHKDGTTK